MSNVFVNMEKKQFQDTDVAKNEEQTISIYSVTCFFLFVHKILAGAMAHIRDCSALGSILME